MKNCSKLSVSSLVAAIGTVVTVAEILKNNGLATEKSKACRHGKLSLSETRHISWHMFHNFYPCSEILTSTIGTKDESKGRLVRKAKVRYDFC